MRLTLLETIIKVVEGLRTDWSVVFLACCFAQAAAISLLNVLCFRLKFADMITPYLKTFFSNTEAFGIVFFVCRNDFLFNSYRTFAFHYSNRWLIRGFVRRFFEAGGVDVVDAMLNTGAVSHSRNRLTV